MEMLHFNICDRIKPFEKSIYFSENFLYVYINSTKIRSNLCNDTTFIFQFFLEENEISPVHVLRFPFRRQSKNLLIEFLANADGIINCGGVKVCFLRERGQIFQGSLSHPANYTL